MADSLFDNDSNKQSQSHDSQDNEDVNYVAHYFGDKEPTIDDYKEIVKGKYFADQHVKTLEIENKGLRKMEETNAKFDDLLSKLTAQASKGKEESNQRSQAPDENQKTVDDDAAKLTPDKIQELIQQQLNKQSEQSIKQQNLAKVKAKAEELFGRNYEQELLKKAKEIGATPSFIESVAVVNPDAFFRMMGMDGTSKQSNPNSAPPKTNTDAVRSGMNNKAGTKNYAYYRNLQKSDPNSYRSKAVQMEMHKMAAEMGADFYS